MCTCYGSFRVKAKGARMREVVMILAMYMCAHVIQRYDDTMIENGGEGRKRKERNKYV